MVGRAFIGEGEEERLSSGDERRKLSLKSSELRAELSVKLIGRMSRGGGRGADDEITGSLGGIMSIE